MSAGRGAIQRRFSWMSRRSTGNSRIASDLRDHLRKPFHGPREPDSEEDWCPCRFLDAAGGTRVEGSNDLAVKSPLLERTPMISLPGSGVSLCEGLTRREWLRAGGLGALGLALPDLL